MKNLNLKDLSIAVIEKLKSPAGEDALPSQKATLESVTLVIEAIEDAMVQGNHLTFSSFALKPQKDAVGYRVQMFKKLKEKIESKRPETISATIKRREKGKELIKKINKPKEN